MFGGCRHAFNPATDGCRNLTGSVNRDGTVTIYAVTSTVSASGDQGADPNQLVKVTDVLNSTTLPVNDDNAWGWGRRPRLGVFETIKAAGYGEVLRGVAFAPEDEHSHRGIGPAKAVIKRVNFNPLRTGISPGPHFFGEVGFSDRDREIGAGPGLPALGSGSGLL